jgi:nucleotide-binding universal stress UspA family protein
MIALRNVLVATDFGEASGTALLYGRELARRFNATLHVLHVVDDLSARVMTASGLPYDVSPAQRDIETQARRQLDGLIAGENASELAIETAQITSTSPADAIVLYAKDAHVDLIIVGTRGRGGLTHFFLGSVAERVVRTAPCPVLTVHHPEQEFVRPDSLQTVATA